jgi:alpha-mannosidase
MMDMGPMKITFAPRRIRVVILAALMIVQAVGAFPPQKRIYIANDDHSDYMWAADEAGYRKAFLDMLDYYLDLADRTAGEPAEYRSRFSADGALWAWIYEKDRTPAQFDRLIQRIKDGSISLPLNLMTLAYGAMPAEAVLRSMYYSGRLERRFGLKLKLALYQENQTIPLGLGTLWAGAGAAYSWKGICGCASRIPDARNRPLDIYWWTGLDGSRILMKWNSMLLNYYHMGGYAEARTMPEVIDFVTADPQFRARYPYDVIGIFGHGGDDLTTLTDRFPAMARGTTTDSRKVIVSDTLDFFKDFESTYGASLPAQSLSFGNEWEILTASMAGLSGRVKRAVEKLRTAEAVAAFVGLQDASSLKGRDERRENAWIDLGMYYEHDWTADGPITPDARAAFERRRAEGFEAYVDGLYDEALPALGRLIQKEKTNPRYFVFNPLGWSRTGPADLPYAGPDPVRAVEVLTGVEAPSQRVTIDGRNFIRIWAENLPSVGYKVYEMIPGAPSVMAGGPTANGDTLENEYCRVRLGPNGSILSLVDKLRGGREMVREIDGRRINDLGAGSGSILIENAGPVSATLRVRSDGPLARATAVTLFRNSGRVDIRNEILQNFSDLQAWSFGFDLNDPDVRHEEIGAVLRARTAEQGGHYSSRAGRTDWLSLNHFVDISGGGNGITISSPDLSFMKLGRSTASVLDTSTPQISILAGGQVDGPGLGIPAQGGDAYFLQRFGLEAHGAYDAPTAMRFALEHQNPPAVGEVTGGTSYPATSFSLLESSAPDVFIWSVKPAEDTNAGGLIIRVWNQAAAPMDFILGFQDYSVLDARRTSLIETPIEPVPFVANLVAGNIPGFGWRAYHVKLDGDPGVEKGIKRKKIR